MMKRAVPILLTLALLAGCATWERANREWERWTRPDTPPAEQPAEPTPEPPRPPEADNNRFLWKPISESRPGAAVLFPARLTVDGMTANGERPAVVRGRTNGNRPTFFMAQQGAAYGSPVEVVAYHGGAEVGRWTVPHGADRWER